MSAASTPAPRSLSSSGSNRSSGPRPSLFWPMIIFLIGAGSLAAYQVMSLEDQLDQVTRATDQMDAKVKHAQYEEAKFFALAREILRLAPKDPNAEKVVVEFRLRQLQAAKPALMDLNAPDAAPVAPKAAPAPLSGIPGAPPALPQTPPLK
jgi:hypothetical protein